MTGLVVACGGKAGGQTDSVGPVHGGKGLYELQIESLSDDCTPPLWSGDAGSVVVVVATEPAATGPRVVANIPLYDDAPDPKFTAARSDANLDQPMVFDLPPSLLPDCADFREHYEVTPLAADAAGIDIEYDRSRSGGASCAQVAPAQTCTSRRIMHFKWRRACAPAGEALECN